MNDLSKLPKWAQEKISTLELQRESAVTALNKFVDSQTQSGIWVEEFDCTGEKQGPSMKRHYIQGDRVTFNHAGVELAVHISRKGDGQRTFGIHLQWGVENKINIRHVAFIPTSFQTAEIVAKENMR